MRYSVVLMLVYNLQCSFLFFKSCKWLKWFKMDGDVLRSLRILQFVNFLHSSERSFWNFSSERFNGLCLWLCALDPFERSTLIWANTKGLYSEHGGELDWAPIFPFLLISRKDFGRKMDFYFSIWAEQSSHSPLKSFMAVICWRAAFNCTLSQHSCSNLQLVNLIVEGGFGSDHKD